MIDTMTTADFNAFINTLIDDFTVSTISTVTGRRLTRTVKADEAIRLVTIAHNRGDRVSASSEGIVTVHTPRRTIIVVPVRLS